MKTKMIKSGIIQSLVILPVFLFNLGCSNAQKNDTENQMQFPKAKSNSEWKAVLTADEYDIMVNKGTEPPFKNAYYNNHKEGTYVSAATGKPLFSSSDKFDSGTGWPSFTNAINSEDVTVVKDNSHGMVRDEIVETATGLHLGHLFRDGPAPSHNRYCINSAALKFIPASTSSNNGGEDQSYTATAYFSSGCFWCAEAIFESVKGVGDVISGYSGGHTQDPSYEDSNTGRTGHAESIKVPYDPSVISFSTLVDVYFGSQDPTQVKGQGPDRGSQYRSIIFYQNDDEKKIIEQKKGALAEKLNETVAAEVRPFEKFWKAEEYHQDYEKSHPENPYIQNVSIPRINRFKKKFPDLLKQDVQ